MHLLDPTPLKKDAEEQEEEGEQKEEGEEFKNTSHLFYRASPLQ